jgi:hypothetical protein
MINPAAPEVGTHHGHEGFKAWLADVEGNLSEFRVAEAELRETHAWTLTDGMVIQMRAHPDHAEALEAAGLSQPS